jgi:protein TonB
MQITKKNPEVSLKLKYRKVMELSLIASLAILLIVFQAFKVFEEKSNLGDQKVDVQIDVQDIPKTEQVKRPPAPSRPAIPIESEDEDISEDETIETTEIDLTELPPPPPAPEQEDESATIFIAYDEAPQPIGGFAAIQKNLEYPEIARKAGVEGTVFVKVLVDAKGNVVDTDVIKSLGNNGCDEAAIKAIKSVKWKPAMQRDKPVKVWVSIPVRFMLK